MSRTTTAPAIATVALTGITAYYAGISHKLFAQILTHSQCPPR